MSSTIRRVADLGALSVAEEQVLRELDSGKPILLGDGNLPDSGDESRRVRAFLIRLLMLGDDKEPKYRLHEQGLRIAGAWITGELNLEGCRGLPGLGLWRCRFSDVLLLRNTRISNLHLDRSFLLGMIADGLETDGDVLLRNVASSSTVSFLGSKLGGSLDCTNSVFQSDKDPANIQRGYSLLAERLVAGGDVCLKRVKATGPVSFSGAELDGAINCNGATFQVDRNTSDYLTEALCLERVVAAGGLLLQNDPPFMVSFQGQFSLVNAEFGVISDEIGCWPKKGDLLLDRCRYGAFVGPAPVDAHSRIGWLARHTSEPGQEFTPQPYEQCAKVLREMGHGSDARKVLIEKERLQRAARRRDRRSWHRAWLEFQDTVLFLTMRYGHQPLWAFAWLFFFFLFGWSVFQTTIDDGAIKPNNAVVLRSAEWVDCAPGRALNEPGITGQVVCFSHQPKGASYPQFNSMIYSMDTLLPIVSLEMQEYWIPDESNGGKYARWYLWGHIAAGWALSLLAVAGFSGLVKSD